MFIGRDLDVRSDAFAIVIGRGDDDDVLAIAKTCAIEVEGIACCTDLIAINGCLVGKRTTATTKSTSQNDSRAAIAGDLHIGESNLWVHSRGFVGIDRDVYGDGVVIAIGRGYFYRVGTIHEITSQQL